VHPLADKPFSYALKENGRVISALVVRTALSRFRKGRLGFVWIVAEPAAFTVLFVLMHSFTPHVPFGDNALLFIVGGVFGFRMTRGISQKTERAIINNLPMLTYPLVKPLDTIIATFILESIIWLLILAAFMCFVAFFMDRAVIVFPAQFAEALAAILFFALSFATFNATVGALIPRYDTVLSMTTMPLMLISGVFYMPAQLPSEVIDYLWWNPFLHCVEWFRTSTYLDYNAVLSREYLVGVSVALFTTGLVAERLYRRKIVGAE
jgi:capsular polysaccharide transport system permease protein